jgi:hypothetical protein
MVKDHRAGKANYTQEIDKIMSFELWLRQNEILIAAGSTAAF